MPRKSVIVAILVVGVVGWVFWASSSLFQTLHTLPPSVPTDSQIDESPRQISDAAPPLAEQPSAKPPVPEETEAENADSVRANEPAPIVSNSSISPACEAVRNAVAKGDHLGRIDQPEFKVAQQLVSELDEGSALNSDISDEIRANFIAAAQDANTVALNQLAFFYRNRIGDLVEGRAWDIIEHNLRHGSLEGYREMPGAESMTEEDKAESVRRANQYIEEYRIAPVLMEEFVLRACG